MHRKPKWVLTGLLAILLVSGDARGQKPVVMVDILKDCVEVRLVGVQRSDTRGQHLIAKMETLEKEPQEILVHFPNHSLTVHEATLQNLMASCCGSQKEGDVFGWRKVRDDVEVRFMVPKWRQPEGPINGKLPPIGVKESEWLEKCSLRELRFKKDN